jgi:hypothetical protein
MQLAVHKTPMRHKFQVAMSPSDDIALRRVAEELKRSRADTIRTLVRERHEQIVRGETSANVPATERGE